MTILEATRTDDNAFAAPGKGFVVKSGAGYRSEQGSDYEPGVSAETVGSKSIWLGMITLPPGKRTRAHVHEHHETALYMLSGDEMELWTGDKLSSRHRASGRLHLHPGEHVARRRESKRAVRRYLSARATRRPLRKVSSYDPRWTEGCPEIPYLCPHHQHPWRACSAGGPIVRRAIHGGSWRRPRHRKLPPEGAAQMGGGAYSPVPACVSSLS